MNVSQEEAKGFLEQAQITGNETRKAVAARYASPILILWGLILAAAYVGTHFFLKWAWPIWLILDTVGSIGTWLICRHQFRSGNPTRIAASQRIGWRIFWFWFLLFAYISMWLSVVSPVNGMQINAFILITIMFAWVVMGLWTAAYPMVWLGLAVTGVTLIGFHAIDHRYYCLWMAVMAGGMILAAGVYLRLRWS